VVRHGSANQAVAQPQRIDKMKKIVPAILLILIIGTQLCAVTPGFLKLHGKTKYLDDSYSEEDASMGFDDTVIAYAQSYSSGGGILDSVVWKLKKEGSPTGNATAKIYAHTETYGTTGKPTGSALATSDTLDVSTLTTSLVEKTFTFSGANRINLATAVSSYPLVCIVISYSGSTSGNNIKVAAMTTGESHGGIESYLVGSTWTTEGADLLFKVYVYR
jgi:hypothetical protein